MAALAGAIPSSAPGAGAGTASLAAILGAAPNPNAPVVEVALGRTVPSLGAAVVPSHED
jgi:hypothetical protein